LARHVGAGGYRCRRCLEGVHWMDCWSTADQSWDCRQWRWYCTRRFVDEHVCQWSRTAWQGWRRWWRKRVHWRHLWLERSRRHSISQRHLWAWYTRGWNYRRGVEQPSRRHRCQLVSNASSRQSRQWQWAGRAVRVGYCYRLHVSSWLSCDQSLMECVEWARSTTTGFSENKKCRSVGCDERWQFVERAGTVITILPSFLWDDQHDRRRCIGPSRRCVEGFVKLLSINCAHCCPRTGHLVYPSKERLWN